MDTTSSTVPGAETAQPIPAGASLIVTTNTGAYYVIPQAALAPYAATPAQRAAIDALVGEEGTGFYSEATAAERSRRPDWASEGPVTATARFHTL